MSTADAQSQPPTIDFEAIEAIETLSGTATSSAWLPVSFRFAVHLTGGASPPASVPVAFVVVEPQGRYATSLTRHFSATDVIASAELFVRSNQVSGLYTIVGRLDPGGFLSESDESNNEVALGTYRIPLPDLVPAELRLPRRVPRGRFLEVRGTIENLSFGAALPSTVRVTVTSTPSPAVVVQDVGVWTMPSYQSRDFVSAPFSVDALPDGLLRVEMVVDALNQLDELVEDDPPLVEYVELVPADPELRAVSTSVSSSVEAGTAVSVECEVANDGFQPATVDVEFWVSEDAVRSADDIRIGGARVYVEAESQAAVGGVYTVPYSTPARTHYVVAVVDPANEYDERFEDDNAVASAQVEVLESPLRLLTKVAPEARVGEPYSASLRTTGSEGPVRWQSLETPPAGLTLTPDGELRGAPSVFGTFGMHVRFADSTRTGRDVVTIRVGGDSVLAVGGASLPDAVVGEPYAYAMRAVGGRAPYAWEARGLPDGFVVSHAGLITGEARRADRHLIEVTVVDGRGASAGATLTLEVVESGERLRLASVELPRGYLGVPYCRTQDTRLEVSGGVPPYVFSALGLEGTGLQISSDGTLCGTPARAGRFLLEVSARDQGGQQVRATYAVVIDGFMPLTNLESVEPSGCTCARRRPTHFGWLLLALGVLIRRPRS